MTCNNWGLVYNFNTSTDTPTFFTDIRSGQSNQFETQGAAWDGTNPNILWALGNPNGTTPTRILYKLDLTQSGQARFTAVHDFTNDLNAIYSAYDPNWRLDELGMSDDNSVATFTVRDANDHTQPWSDQILYTVSSNTVSTWPRPSGFSIHAGFMDKAGQHVVINADTGAQPQPGAATTAFWNLASNTTDILNWNSSDAPGGHDDHGNLYVNDDVWGIQIPQGHPSTGGLLKRNYGSAVHSPTNIFHYWKDNNQNVGNYVNDHVSYREDAGQYAVVGTYWGTDYTYALTNEIFMVRTDGTSFSRLAHTRSTATSDYDHQVRPALDRLGHYIVFHSDMGGGSSALNDVFIVKIPSNLWPGSGCTAPLSSCPGLSGCFDLTSDPSHCGSCSTVCPPTASCSASACHCPSGQTQCGNSCIDTTKDSNNCGSCGHACSTGQACVNSSCVVPSSNNVKGTDINADNKGDFLARDSNGNFQVWLSNGTIETNTVTYSSYYTDTAGWNDSSRFFAMDIDGDNKTDLLARSYNGAFDVNLSNGSQPVLHHSFSTTLSDTNGWDAVNRLYAADVNGDGKWDLVARQSDGNWQKWISNGSVLQSSGTFSSYYTDAAGFASGNCFYFLDINGDGKTDYIARYSTGAFDVWTSTGTSYNQTASVSSSYSDALGFRNGDYFFVADVNGDHKGDLLVRNPNGTFDVWLSNGTTLVYSTSFTSYFTDTGGAATGNRWFIRDVNGDGKTDFIVRYANGAFEVWLSNGSTLANSTAFSTSLTDTNGWASGARFF